MAKQLNLHLLGAPSPDPGRYFNFWLNRDWMDNFHLKLHFSSETPYLASHFYFNFSLNRGWLDMNDMKPRNWYQVWVTFQILSILGRCSPSAGQNSIPYEPKLADWSIRKTASHMGYSASHMGRWLAYGRFAEPLNGGFCCRAPHGVWHVAHTRVLGAEPLTSLMSYSLKRPILPLLKTDFTIWRLISLKF